MDGPETSRLFPDVADNPTVVEKIAHRMHSYDYVVGDTDHLTMTSPSKCQHCTRRIGCNPGVYVFRSGKCGRDDCYFLLGSYPC